MTSTTAAIVLNNIEADVNVVGFQFLRCEYLSGNDCSDQHSSRKMKIIGQHLNSSVSSRRELRRAQRCSHVYVKFIKVSQVLLLTSVQERSTEEHLSEKRHDFMDQKCSANVNLG